MAITYPRDLPTAGGLVECSFNLEDGVSMSPSKRGLVINRTQTTDPRWVAKIESGRIEDDDKAAWSSWKKSLAGLRTFVAWDIRLPTPLAYKSATASTDISGGWDGTATVTSVSQTLGLSGLPSTYQAKAGDRVGLEETVSSIKRWGYFEVLEDATATAGAATLTVAPVLGALLQGVFTTSAVARLWRPKCQFVLDGTTWQEQTIADPTGVSFEAMQLL